MSALRGGYTTGACAAAAAKAAALVLSGGVPPPVVEITLQDGSRVSFSVAFCRRQGDAVEAAVQKDAGDDPDVTDGSQIVARLEFVPGDEIRFSAGEGVGVVTKLGLSVAPGEPAINPGPRAMIRAAVAEVMRRGVRVTVAIPGGEKLAARTFNPRLGIAGGLSILGTTGRVRPVSVPALCDALKCALDVARACGISAPVLVPGNIGDRAARRHLTLRSEQVIQVNNQWGFMLDHAARCGFERLLILGHPGKLAKLADGDWDTHSSHSKSPVPAVSALGARLIGAALPESATVEGIFAGLTPADRSLLAGALASAVRQAIIERIGQETPVSVLLVNMAGDVLGADGDLSVWQ
ncbi:MAG TPA: cobalt-precorrin-5B (C(1))-methyltransferase CbiD [Candidatus Baltobacteraceae bacterium]|nr:cobalt-precorrin-5B (C(1))-methyltransferase CbiD [Candidatus Baltobacteraceae bacterium]